MPGTCDDVIAIRVDAARAIADFQELLRRQAEEGETEAPAKPANRAVFRELAPYRLVEYDYVEPGAGPVVGAYVAFPDGSVYSCGEVIPEEAVDALVAGDAAAVPPLYVYVLLERPVAGEAAERYLDALAGHLGMPLVGVLRGGGTRARIHVGDALVDPAQVPILQAQAEAAAGETGRHLSKTEVLERHTCSSRLPDGRAYAHLSHRFSRRILEFPTTAERDDFVAWSHRFCALAQAEGVALRAAEPCAAPPPTFNLIRVPPPPASADGDRAYWAEVTAIIDAVIDAEQARVRDKKKG